MKELFPYLKKYTGWIILSFFLSLLSVVGDLLIPVFCGDAINILMEEGSIHPLILKLLAVSLLLAISQYLLSLCNQKITYSLNEKLRNDFIVKLQKLPLSYLDRARKGDLLSRCISDVDVVCDGLLLGTSRLFNGILTIVLTIVIMLKIDVRISLLIVVLTPLSVFVTGFIASHISKYLKQQSVLKGQETALINELVNNDRTIRLFDYEETSYQNLNHVNEELKKVSQKAVFYSSLTNPASRLVNNIIYAVIALFACLISKNGRVLSVGDVSVFLNYSSKYAKPFNEIATVISDLESSLVSFHRLLEIYQQKEEEETKNGIVPDSPQVVEIDNIRFAYNKDKYIINGLSLTAHRGEKIAIVGPTGSGKTTLINLMMRFYDVSEGDIRLDGVSIYDMDRKHLRSLFGMVLQDTYLKEASILENIAYGNPDATYEEIVEAAQKAHADGFIRKMKDLYDSPILENGANLSYGQKQLLCLARVFAAKPSILILDEATSSIDSKTEIDVQKGLEELMKDSLCFIVAHRLSTIEHADKIIFLQDGVIKEEGTHKELMERHSYYYNLYNSQFEK